MTNSGQHINCCVCPVVAGHGVSVRDCSCLCHNAPLGPDPETVWVVRWSCPTKPLGLPDVIIGVYATEVLATEDIRRDIMIRYQYHRAVAGSWNEHSHHVTISWSAKGEPDYYTWDEFPVQR